MDNSLLASFGSIFTWAAPVVFAVMGETLTEKSGVINLSLNGSMILSAMAGFAVATTTGSFFWGFLAGAAVGALVAFIIAFMSIGLKQSQVAVGYVLTLATKSLAYFLGAPFVGKPVMQLSLVKIPFLDQLPILGPVIFNKDIVTYLSYLLVIVCYIWVFKTSKGLILQGIGEQPAAAFVRGANVNRLRYIYTIIGGALVGIGGAQYSLSVKTWNGQLTGIDGIGWIALAITIFGSWHPVRGALGSYFFVLLQWLGITLQPLMPNVNSRIFQVAPFPLMILALLFVNIGSADWVERTLAGLPEGGRKFVSRLIRGMRTHSPAALGTPFDNE
ncbi:MAG TPA: ABC transporter permease [Anaerolineaceae bacterium]|jgi:simple sugar transport system permease protein|nr:ABC transporter permease [Anaerolineaceae bacterium]